MTEPLQDMWSAWLLKRRFGGDPERMKKMLEILYVWRDKVLSHIDLRENETLLDVGCGDGLIGFGALQKWETCRVIFSDISEDLLNHAENLARDLGVRDRCRFVRASADDLSMLETGSVEGVTTRSVLIYVSDKQKAFNEFYRVLTSSGQLSIFEPINRFGFPEPPNLFGGYDVTPVMDIAQKLEALYQQIQPPDIDPMTDFDERDLLDRVEKAGFSEIQLELQIAIKPHEFGDWSAFLHTAANPKIPTLAEAMEQVLTPQEIESFINHIRPLVEARQGTRRSAIAYLWAVK